MNISANSPAREWPQDLVFPWLFRGLSRGGGAGARLSIVIFHRVLAQPDALFPEEMDAARFSRICAWLSSWFQILPLQEAVRRQLEGTLPGRALAITFDDGYADNHDIAMPILRQHGLSATFFIATGFLDGGRMWNDTVIESIRRCRHQMLDLAALGLAGLGEVALASHDDRRRAALALISAIKYLPSDQRAATVARVAQLADATLPDDLMMSADQVRGMLSGGMQLGAHTVTHPILARLDEGKARAEIEGGRAALEQIIQRPVNLFAYPNGKPNIDYTRRDVELVKRAGFTAAVSTAPGAGRPGQGAGLYELPRFTPWDIKPWAFGVRMARNFLVPPAQAARTP